MCFCFAAQHLCRCRRPAPPTGPACETRCVGHVIILVGAAASACCAAERACHRPRLAGGAEGRLSLSSPIADFSALSPERLVVVRVVNSWLRLGLKGVSEIMPIFETAFVLVCHYAISKLCQGMCHHYGARHVSPRLHIHRFRPWAPVRLPGVCFLTNACGSPIAHFKRSCSPAGWICGKRASGHRGGS